MRELLDACGKRCEFCGCLWLKSHFLLVWSVWIQGGRAPHLLSLTYIHFPQWLGDEVRVSCHPPTEGPHEITLHTYFKSPQQATSVVLAWIRSLRVCCSRLLLIRTPLIRTRWSQCPYPPLVMIFEAVMNRAVTTMRHLRHLPPHNTSACMHSLDQSIKSSKEWACCVPAYSV